MQLCLWAAGYYHHPLGDVLQNAVPALLRHPDISPDGAEEIVRITAEGQLIDPASLGRSPRQREILTRLCDAGGHLPLAVMKLGNLFGAPLKSLLEKGWVERTLLTTKTRPWHLDHSDLIGEPPHEPNAEQQLAIANILTKDSESQCYLLDGITGSGKTEVYLRVIEQTLLEHKQALVLVPEIGLTPQIVDRFRRRFKVPIVVLHSSLTDRERLIAWRAAGSGEAAIVIGTRSAIFTPLASPGVIVVDEEHDLSYKQQEGFRYSARDIAVMRASLEKLPIILGSATPSLESIHNVKRGRYQSLSLTQRTGHAVIPGFQLYDIKNRQLQGGLVQPLLDLTREHLEQGNQVLVFLNRRGFAPTLLCHACNWIANCRRCDARLTVHRQSQSLRCHHCGGQSPMPASCPQCNATHLVPLGTGTQRTEQVLQTYFPDQRIIRIDRDTTRGKSAMSDFLKSVDDGKPCILIGTQMLAKGHHFPDVTLVAVVDVDAGLFSADFRATERMAQLIVQVSGRAGRAEKPGLVAIQTHFVDHPILQTLIRGGYPAFAAQTLQERKETSLPPFSYMALIRAQSGQQQQPSSFLTEVRDIAHQVPMGEVGIQTLGPIPSVMEKKAGKFRYVLLFQSASRNELAHLLSILTDRIESLRSARLVRWSIDVDPLDIF
jgi:primosomal protein N' (replication factor Y)